MLGFRAGVFSSVKAVVRSLAVGSLLVLPLAGCVQSDLPSPSGGAANEVLDPLTCYIAGDVSVDTPGVTLRCGGGNAVEVDLGEADVSTPAVEVGKPVLDWVVTRASKGTSSHGSSIVRVHVEGGESRCVYYRDMAETPENTTTSCL